MTYPWLVRTYDPSLDESGVIYLWLKSFAHSSYGKGRRAQFDGSPEEREFWKEHRDVVLNLLVKGKTEILCDPEAKEVIWAFACTQGDVVHYAVVKRRFKEEAEGMFDVLLGNKDEPRVYTHDFSGTGFRVPSNWRFNPYAVIL